MQKCEEHMAKPSLNEQQFNINKTKKGVLL